MCICIWCWDITYPWFVKALKKVTKGKTCSYDRTAFRSPIGPGRECQTKVGKFLLCCLAFRVYFGCFKNMQEQKTMAKTHAYSVNEHAAR